MNYFIIFLIIFLTVLFLYIWHTMSSTLSSSSDKFIFNPMSAQSKATCVNTKTPCDPNDSNSCNNSCTEQELMCVNLDDYQPSITKSGEAPKNINGGGHVCLPSRPNLDCNFNNGGAIVWTGYGFTENANWSCLCTEPSVFSGPSCKTQNPSFCSGGTVTVDPNKSFDYNNLCNCPSGTVMLYRDNNIPICVPNVPNVGQGYKGLAGNRDNTWVSLLVNPNKGDNCVNWSQEISSELNISSVPVLEILLNSKLNPSIPPVILTQQQADAICKIPEFSSKTQFKKYCTPSPDGSYVASNFTLPNDLVVNYTYYDNTYLP
jgi:hypothetical protein